MLKKVGILLLGIICGVAVMYFFSPRNEPLASPVSAPSLDHRTETSRVDYDAIYDSLQQENRGTQKDKYWFDQRVEDMDAETKHLSEQMQAAGDDAAKVIEKFSEPEKP